MLKALWFFLQIAAVIAASLWLLERPGSVTAEFLSYTVTAPTGIILLALVIIFFVLLTLFRFAATLTSIPKRLTKRNADKRKDKAYRLLTRGLAAVAAGDTKAANMLSQQVRALLPEEKGLPALLEAQAARLRGDEGAARRSFESLMEDKDAAFFGIRGLLKSSLDAKDTGRALEYARKARRLHPHQGWVLQIVYRLEIQARLWDDAAKTLKQMQKFKTVSAMQANSDRVAMLLEQAATLPEDGGALKLLKKAHARDPSSIPAAIKLAEAYIKKCAYRRAASVIEKTWKINPHPELASLWASLAPDKNSKKVTPEKRMRWFERLVALKTDSALGQMTAARAALEEGLIGEARAYLSAAEKICPTAALYRLWAELEDRTGKNSHAARVWLEKAADAPPDKIWTCRETGRVYQSWSAIAQPHGAFNTIVWDVPQGPAISIVELDGPDPLMLRPVNSLD